MRAHTTWKLHKKCRFCFLTFKNKGDRHTAHVKIFHLSCISEAFLSNHDNNSEQSSKPTNVIIIIAFLAVRTLFLFYSRLLSLFHIENVVLSLKWKQAKLRMEFIDSFATMSHNHILGSGIPNMYTVKNFYYSLLPVANRFKLNRFKEQTMITSWDILWSYVDYAPLHTNETSIRIL